MAAVTLRVNGKSVTVTPDDPNTPLRANWQARPSFSALTPGEVAFGRGIAALGEPRDTNVVGIFEVAVNRSTGLVHVTRMVVAQDCGLVVRMREMPFTPDRVLAALKEAA